MGILIEGNLCVLQDMREEYLPRHVEFQNDPLVHRYLIRRPPFALEEQRAWLNRMKDSVADNVLAILAKDSSSNSPVFVGVMGLHDINSALRTAKSGTIIGDKRYWGRGIGTEAKFLQLKYAFTELNLSWVSSSIAAGNLRSLGFLRNTGYRKVGVNPRARLIDGEYLDEIIMRVSRGVWERRWNDYKMRHPASVYT